MKVTVLICRILLGLIFILFGLNGFLHFLPQPPQTGLALQFFTVMTESHYWAPIFALQLICGVMFVLGQWVPLALVLIGPVIVNILLFHILMAPESIAPGLLVTVLWFVVAYANRAAFTGIFRQHVE